MNKEFFCFGLGYSAHALAEALAQDGWKISGAVRSEEKAASLSEKGWRVSALDSPGSDTEIVEALSTASYLLSSAPPVEGRDPILERFKPTLRMSGRFDWIGYLSTTGVYGDRDGGWVDEESDLLPTGPRGEARVACEAAWTALAADLDAPVFHFRLAGIYGPGRNALETVRRGRARRIDKPGQVFSRIHLDDIVTILSAALNHPEHPGAYNCCDDNPAPPEEVIAYACTLLGVETPPLVPFDQADLTPMAKSFYRDNKRVDNTKIKEKLGVTLKWPSYQRALKAIHKALETE